MVVGSRFIPSRKAETGSGKREDLTPQQIKVLAELMKDLKDG
jgi:hypothetical protein